MARKVFSQEDATEAQISILNDLKSILRSAENTRTDLVFKRYGNAEINNKNAIGSLEKLIKELEVDIKIEAPKFEQQSF